jgi:uncharacterized protein YxeA
MYDIMKKLLLVIVGLVLLVSCASAAFNNASVITWDENKIVVTYDVDKDIAEKGYFLQICHDDFGYPVTYFDFDMEGKQKGTIETAPVETYMKIKDYHWYVRLIEKDVGSDMEDMEKKIVKEPFFKFDKNKMPSVTADIKYKSVK